MSYNVTVKNESDTAVLIEGSISTEKLESYRPAVMKYFNDKADIDGFRKGNIPENILKDRLGPGTILQEMAERALREAYPEIIREHKIEAIDRPEIAITKLAEDNPLEFKITQTVMPAIKLPDYKKIAGKANNKFDKDNPTPVVTDEELDGTIKNIRDSRKKNQQDENEVAPALTDEFVKELGDFVSVDDFKTKLRENIKHEKEMRHKDGRRMNTVNEILKETKIEAPEILVNRQLDQFMAETKGQIAQMGLSFEDYLKHSKKTEEDLRKDARTDAEKRVQVNLLLEAMIKAEDVKAPEDKVTEQLAQIMKAYPDANENGARDYVESILKNDQIFQVLESQK